MRKALSAVLLCGFIIVTGCLSPKSTPTATSTPNLSAFSRTDPTPQHHNVPYVPGNSSQQVLDVYLPTEGEGPFPTILALHGGGFRTRSKELYSSLAGYFTDMGYALVPINYRLAPQYTYPAQVEDAFCALAWVFKNAEAFGFDSERIFIMGDSAGGYLAAMLGTVETPDIYKGECPHMLSDPDLIRGVVVFYGFYDLTSLDGHGIVEIRDGLEPFMGATHSEVSPEKLAEMSPKSWLDGSEPPFLIIHGTEDQSVQSWLAEDFIASLEEFGIKGDLVLLEDTHAFILQPVSSPTMTKALDSVISFLNE